MSLIKINRNPPRSQLAVFGLIWLVFFAGFGALMLWRGRPWSLVGPVWVMAAVVPAIGWIVPAFMRIVYLGMAYLTFPIGFVLSFVLMVIIYYLVLTPVGLIMRIVGYDPIRRAFEPKAQSYWIARSGDDSAKRYFRQF